MGLGMRNILPQDHMPQNSLGSGVPLTLLKKENKIRRWNNKRKKEIQVVNPLPQDSTAGQSLLGSGTKKRKKNSNENGYESQKLIELTEDTVLTK